MPQANCPMAITPLATTGLRVYEVGERVGYPSVEHFSRVFKKLVGVSPVRFKAGYGRPEDGDGAPS